MKIFFFQFFILDIPTSTESLSVSGLYWLSTTPGRYCTDLWGSLQSALAPPFYLLQEPLKIPVVPCFEKEKRKIYHLAIKLNLKKINFEKTKIVMEFKW